MSSKDQVFVKAFSRRRLAEPDRLTRHNPHPSDVASAEAAENPSDRESNGQFGSLELNRAIAGTAELWLDQVEPHIARADQANSGVPRPHVVDRAPDVDRTPHVDRVVSFEHRDRESRENVEIRLRSTEEASAKSTAETKPEQTQENLAASVDPLQHIHTAYAGAFADASFIASSTSFDGRLEVATEIYEPANHEPLSVSRSSRAAAPTNSIEQVIDHEPSQRSAHRPPVEQPVELAGESDEEPVVEMRIDPPTSTLSQDSTATYVPFQAVWEVDVFDVPAPVADLFFEGALFQQIAERMSEAVGSGLRTVLVTSTKPGEGRSSVAIGMAMAAAAAGIRVALVDADTESPSLADELRLDLQYGWVDVIRRGLPIKEIAVQAVEDGVTLIPLMPPGVRPAATAFEMVQLMDLLTNNFELIILDGPTSLSSGLPQCASRVDSAVIVRDVTRTEEQAIGELSSRLLNAGVRGVGVVENFV